MITEEELKGNGFVHTDDWNNRSYYKKGDFEIVEHNGKIYRCMIIIGVALEQK